MKKIIVKINVKRKGLTNADVYEVHANDEQFLKHLGNILIGGAANPDVEYLKFKIGSHIGINNFNMEVV